MARVLPDAGRVPGPDLVFLTPAEVGDLLEVSLRTLNVWNTDGSGPPRSSLTPSKVVYERDALLDWIDRHYSGDPGVGRSGDRLIRRQEVAEMIRVSIQTLERYQAGAYAGLEGPEVVTISRSTVRYWESDIKNWVRCHARRRQEEKPRGSEAGRR